MGNESLAAVDRLVTATLNGVGQGLLLALLVALVMRLAGRTNAATRHAVWFFTLILIAGLIPANCLRDFIPKSKGPSEAPSPESQALSDPDADMITEAALVGATAEQGLRAPMKTSGSNNNDPPLLKPAPAPAEYALPGGSEFASDNSVVK